VIFATLNNWQRGDYKPYIVKSTDRGRTWTNITGDLPDRHDVWSIIQDHVNGSLLFAGTEFGLFFSVDGGRHWVQLKGGMPIIQVRDMTVQRRENDLVLATFGRGFYVLDDYSALREVSAEALAAEARLFPLRDAYSYSVLGMAPAGTAASRRCRATGRRRTRRSGRCSRITSARTSPERRKLVLTISDDTGKQVRRLDLEKTAGLRRIVWNLRAMLPPQRRGRAMMSRRRLMVARLAGWRPGGRSGRRPRGQAGAPAGAPGAQTFTGGRGGMQAPLAAPGRYQAVLGKLEGDKVTPLGPAQSFFVVQIPAVRPRRGAHSRPRAVGVGCRAEGTS